MSSSHFLRGGEGDAADHLCVDGGGGGGEEGEGEKGLHPDGLTVEGRTAKKNKSKWPLYCFVLQEAGLFEERDR